MSRLLEGARNFHYRVHEYYAEDFTGLARHQNPHTLFIACSDSRVDPNLITGCRPGELFTLRNIANIVPDYRSADQDTGVSSGIEYAVSVLNVESIVVCGHSNCGGCGAMISGHLDGLPLTRRWLEFAGSVSGENRKTTIEQHNVVQQLENLRTYPFVRERESAGILYLYGWYYDLASGRIYNYDKTENRFMSM